MTHCEKTQCMNTTNNLYGYSLEIIPIHVTRMLDHSGVLSSSGAFDATITSSCVLDSMVVLLQMTLVLHGIVMSRKVQSFVVDHMRSLSQEYLRFTPLTYADSPYAAVV